MENTLEEVISKSKDEEYKRAWDIVEEEGYESIVGFLSDY